METEVETEVKEPVALSVATTVSGDVSVSGVQLAVLDSPARIKPDASEEPKPSAAPAIVFHSAPAPAVVPVPPAFPAPAAIVVSPTLPVASVTTIRATPSGKRQVRGRARQIHGDALLCVNGRQCQRDGGIRLHGAPVGPPGTDGGGTWRRMGISKGRIPGTFGSRRFGVDIDRENVGREIEVQMRKAMKEAQMSGDVRRSQERERQQIENAVREQKRAMEEMKSAKLQELSRIVPEAREGEMKSLDAQRQALKARRKALEQQMNSLEEELERLEETRQNLKEQLKNAGAKPEAKVSAPAADDDRRIKKVAPPE